MEIETNSGLKRIRILSFPAIEGWDIRNKFASFANSNDADFRKKYVMRVLGYARVAMGQHELPLTTSALIDNHLGNSSNILKVFSAILNANGIVIDDAANKTDPITAKGSEIATSFVSSCMDALNNFVYFMEKAK